MQNTYNPQTTAWGSQIQGSWASTGTTVRVGTVPARSIAKPAATPAKFITVRNNSTALPAATVATIAINAIKIGYSFAGSYIAEKAAPVVKSIPSAVWNNSVTRGCVIGLAGTGAGILAVAAVGGQVEISGGAFAFGCASSAASSFVATRDQVRGQMMEMTNTSLETYEMWMRYIY